MAAEIIDIRHFGPEPFQNLLQAESRAWLQALRWDYAPSARLISACLAEKRLTGYALAEGRHIQGYSFFLYEGEKGLIGDFYVLPGTPDDQMLNLLDHVIETLVGTPGLRRIEAQIPHYPASALEATFRRAGFNIYSRRFMTFDLNARTIPDSPAAASGEFSLEEWKRHHDLPASQLIYHTYREHIDAAINDQYLTPWGCQRLLGNIIELRGCGENLPGASRVAIHRASHKLAGVLAITSVRQGTAHIPQIAVATEFQSRGLGAALMGSSFRELAGEGYNEVSLTVTDDNAGAVRFYERVGFVTFQKFGAYVWQRD